MSTLALDRLVTDVRPAVLDAVDVLHVAAILESRGMTDELARERYGREDVFDLAAFVRERTHARAREGLDGAQYQHPGAQPVPARRSPVRSDVAWGRSSIGHGAIYLLPALSMPALLALVGPRFVILALVVGGSVGWAWVVVATWRAYVVWSASGREAARRVLRLLTLVGVVVGIGVGAVLVRGLALPPVVGIVAAAVTVAQLGTTLLFFLRRRVALVLIFLAPAAVGAGWLADPGRVPGAAVLVVFVGAGVAAVALGCAGLVRSPGRPETLTRLDPSVLAWVSAYALTSVAFLLLPQAVLLATEPVAVVALAGLFVAMGVVEWRGSRLSELLRLRLATENRVDTYRRRVLWLALREVTVCGLVAAVTSSAVLLVMERLGVLSPTAVALGLTAVPLAGVYALSLILANTGAYSWLAVAFLVGVALEALVPLVLWVPTVTAFTAAAAVVLVALLVGVVTRPLDRYR